MSRVLHLIVSLGQGGAECQMTYLARGLCQLGWEVHVGFLEDGSNRPRLLAGGAAVHEIPARGAYDPRTPVRVLRLIRRVRPDLVQTWIPMMDVVGGSAARWTRTPWVMSERNTPDCFPDGPKFFVRRRLARGASAVVSNSGAADAYWAPRLPASVRRYVIPNALPLDEIRAAPSQPADDLGVAADRPLILSAGRLNEQKNVKLLLPALEQVVRRSDATALLCGVGPLAPWASSYIETRGLGDRIRMAGFVPRLWPWMKRASLFVSVSRWEGMPNTVMEAAAAGCPLLLSEIPQHTSVLEPDSACFTRAEDPTQVADAVLAVLSQLADAKARAQRAQRRAESWSIRAAATRYAGVYEDVLAGRRAS